MQIVFNQFNVQMYHFDESVVDKVFGAKYIKVFGLPDETNVILTYNKVYNVTGMVRTVEDKMLVNVICDDNIARWLPLYENFIPLDEYRNNKIDDLCK